MQPNQQPQVVLFLDVLIFFLVLTYLRYIIMYGSEMECGSGVLNQQQTVRTIF